MWPVEKVWERAPFLPSGDGSGASVCLWGWGGQHHYAHRPGEGLTHQLTQTVGRVVQSLPHQSVRTVGCLNFSFNSSSAFFFVEKKSSSSSSTHWSLVLSVFTCAQGPSSSWQPRVPTMGLVLLSDHL